MDNLVLDHYIRPHDPLLTEEEKITTVIQLLGAGFRHHGELFKPEDDFYAWHDAEIGLQKMAKKMFSWLGIKPTRIVISFSSEMQAQSLYIQNGLQSTILINKRYSQKPLQTAALLAHEIMHYFLIAKKKFVLEDSFQNEQLADLASIYSGLGLVIMNGFGDNAGWVNKQWYRILGIFGKNPEYIDIGLLQPADHARKLADFATNNSINPFTFSNYLMPGTKDFFPETIQTATDSSLKKPTVIQLSEQYIHSNNIFAVGVLALLVTIAALAIYLNYKKPPYLPEDLTVQLREIQSLKTSYDTCIADVAKKRSQVDETDILAERSINAATTRCLSIKNRHDYEVRLYNQRVEELSR